MSGDDYRDEMSALLIRFLDAGWSQRALAEALTEMGYSTRQPTLSGWIRKRYRVLFQTYDYMRLKLDELGGGKGRWQGGRKTARTG